MDRYKPVGWRYESYRHSLAARGYRTSHAMRRSEPLDLYTLQRRSGERERGVSSGPTLIKRVHRPLSRKAEIEEEIQWIENILEDPESDISESRKKELSTSLGELKERSSHITGRPPIRKVGAEEDIPLGLYDRYKGKSGKVPNVVKDFLGTDLKKSDIERAAHYADVKRRGIDERAAERSLEGIDANVTKVENPEDLEDMDLIDANVLVKNRRRIDYAGKEDNPRFIGHDGQHVSDFWHDNVDGHHDDHRLEHFWRGASHTLFRPGDDLDGDWKSFNAAAGRKVEPSKNSVERAQERGAALVGRVVTLANVEPMIDHDKDRNFRDSMVDLAFGRRTD